MEESKQEKAMAAGSSEVREAIVEAYRVYVLENGAEPASIYAFCTNLGISEDEFYQHFNQFDQVGEAFWQDLLRGIWKRLEEDPNYVELSVREKILSFYFDFFSAMRKHRSFFLISLSESWLGLGSESKMSKLKSEFRKWISRMVDEGIARGEISARSKISDAYDHLFWMQFMFLVNFWKKDRSKGFEKTDAAVEKTVNLSFDLIEKNAIDSALDFGKFMYQNR